jgi:hypothetical protein
VSPKTPEQWREYRRENKERINENRRKKKQDKLESEKLRLMKPLDLETTARPAKSEQQSIIACEDNDLSSVAQLEVKPPAQLGEEPQEVVVAEEAQDLGYAMASGFGFQAQAPRQPALWVVPDLGSTIDQAQEPEAQSDHYLPNHKDCEIDSGKQSALLIEEKAGRPFLTYLFSLCIVVFLGFNTAFLVLEQSSLYTSLGYSGAIALMIAILTESALILLSTMASWTPGWGWKIGLYAGCAGTGLVIFSLLNVSVENRAAGKLASSENAEMIKKEILTFETLEATALQSIQSLDPKVFPTKINRLTSKLNAPGPEGFTHRLGELRGKLAGLSASGSVLQEIQVLQWQRWAAMGWNILMAAFLGSLLTGEKKKSLLKQGMESWRHYFRRPCKV